MEAAPRPQAAQARRTMNVLYVNLYSELGGGEIALLETLRSVDRSAVRPVMLFQSDGPFPAESRRLGLDTVIVPFPAVMLRRLVAPAVVAGLLAASVRVHRLLRDEKIDVVQCSDILTLLVVALPVMLRRLPVVYCMIFFDHWLRLMVFNLLAAVLVERIVATSSPVARALVSQTMMLDRKITVIEPGVDRERFGSVPRDHELRDGAGEKTVFVGMISRFEAGKGHELFLGAAAALLRRGFDARFVVVGGPIHCTVHPANIRYREAITRSAEAIGAGDRLEFLGQRDDVPAILGALDLVVVPSECEGFGLVVLEALAAGVPVVLSRSVGAWETVRDAPGVFVAERRSPEAFADTIRRAAERGLSRGEVRAGLADRLSWKRSAEEFARLYGDILGSSNQFSSHYSGME